MGEIRNFVCLMLLGASLVNEVVAQETVCGEGYTLTADDYCCPYDHVVKISGRSPLGCCKDGKLYLNGEFVDSPYCATCNGQLKYVVELNCVAVFDGPDKENELKSIADPCPLNKTRNLKQQPQCVYLLQEKEGESCSAFNYYGNCYTEDKSQAVNSYECYGQDETIAFESTEALCCRDGFNIANGEVKLNPFCGCPKDGVLLDKENNGICCKDNFTWDFETEAYTEINATCGCPNGGKPDPMYGFYCCRDEKEWNVFKKDYTDFNASCGCPDGGVPERVFSSTGAQRALCCKEGYIYNPKTKVYDLFGCDCHGNLECERRKQTSTTHPEG